jgi:hypothetical protein
VGLASHSANRNAHGGCRRGLVQEETVLNYRLETVTNLTIAAFFLPFWLGAIRNMFGGR